MGCFLAPLAEAVVVSTAAVIVKAKENKKIDKTQTLTEEMEESAHKVSKRLFRLTYLLYGGAILLLFEHIWHGEIIGTFPFFTAVKEGETLGMLKEIGTTGVGMAILCTAVWGAIEVFRSLFTRKKSEKMATEQ